MDFFELLRQVKEGRITSTYCYRVSIIETNEDSIKDRIFFSIIEAINDEYLVGEVDKSKESLNYKNLKLTQKGEKFLKSASLKIDEIKNPNLLQGISRSLIISSILFIIGIVFNYFFPDAKNQIKNISISLLEKIF